MPVNTNANGELYIFGGLVRESARNDLYLFSTRDSSASLWQTGGEIPSPRVGHASALISNVLIVWGGDTKTDSKAHPGELQDDGLYLLNLGMMHGFICDIGFVIHSSLFTSLKGMDPSGCLRFCSCRKIWSRSCHGRIKILCFWWTGRWRVLE